MERDTFPNDDEPLTWRGRLVVLLLLAVAVAALWAVCFFGVGAYAHGYEGSGDHVGYATSVECDGLWWHTCRVHIKTDNSSSQEDAYCVKDAGLMDFLRQAAKDKTRLDFHYNSYHMWQKGCGFDGPSTIVSAVVEPGTCP